LVKLPHSAALEATSRFCVGENEHGIFAAEFQDAGCEVSGAGFCDAAAGCDAAGEKYFVGAGVNSKPGRFRRRLHDVDERIGETDARKHFLNQGAAFRSEVARLANDGVPAAIAAMIWPIGMASG